MFEQATLASGPAGKRAWTTLLGFASQAGLIATAILAPIVFPQVMPSPQWLTMLPPVPHGERHPDKKPDRQPAATRRARATRTWTGILIAPVSYPQKAARIEDEPDVSDGPVVRGGLDIGGPGVPGGTLLDSLVPMSRVPEPFHPPVKRPVDMPAPVTVQRLTQGGNVQLGRLLHKVEPAYPPLAKATGTGGTVVLECVVGTDGRMREVRVISGNPLLTKAAAEAVLQWVYAPTQLNGTPIEIVANITISFKLN